MSNTLADDPEWVLLRTLVISVGDPPAEIDWRGRLGSVGVETITPVTKDGEPLGTLVIAHRNLDGPPVRDGVFDLPEDARAEAEEALEMLARLIALEYGKRFSLASPSPCLGFHCTDPAALDALDGTPAGQPRAGLSMEGVASAGILEDGELLDVIGTRPDGLIMLTEALNARSPVGQFTIIWRMFERAFHRGFREAAPLLHEFLSSGPHGFERAEVDEWVDRRNSAVHANRPTDPVLDRHVQPFIGRMREAAFDVLLNKAVWHDSAPDRRVDHPWRPASGSSGPDGGVFVTRGKEAALQTQLLDPFRPFPLLLAGGPRPLVPPGLWLTHEDKDLVLRRLREVDVLLGIAHT
ncbi:hypothetical protein ABTX24_19320 [Nocardioides sp. NPDC127514]|uniref:hypothetical protein n=1 Tax=unclassified Nocardioides TaxID=2615069 RepID=UPI0033331E9F